MKYADSKGSQLEKRKIEVDKSSEEEEDKPAGLQLTI